MNNEPAKGWDAIKAWRKARREETIAWRAGLDRATHQAWDGEITRRLIALCPVEEECVVGFCWPFQGEFDARFAVRTWREQGAIAALPQVVAKATPLQFRAWWPGAPMTKGVYDIPFPDGTEIVLPDVAIVPMNTFDERGYRLGYGGGFFDRTLAALERRTLAVGIAYERLRAPTIHPQEHDIAMDFVVTERATYAGGGETLKELDADAARAHAAHLMRIRRLPRALYSSEYSSPVCYGGQFDDSGDGRG
jgi:5-formyltetrahydrofolate cyclo-ligase